MKQIGLLTVLLAGILNVNAQTPPTHTPTDQTTNGITLVSDNENTNEMLNVIKMDKDNNTIRFSNLPERQPVGAYITNADGDMMNHYKLTTANNRIDVAGLPPGIYDVTLLNKNNRRVFKVHI